MYTHICTHTHQQATDRCSTGQTDAARDRQMQHGTDRLMQRNYAHRTVSTDQWKAEPPRQQAVEQQLRRYVEGTTGGRTPRAPQRAEDKRRKNASGQKKNFSGQKENITGQKGNIRGQKGRKHQRTKGGKR